ncbi:putative transcription factor c2h2 protein [Rosellinia necatrix]|uniref:Putative transcription factor c2h2 protein n=1 Tax=Rosellinia necatrix TaxID=77044 RepID=A0A1W2TPE4_ROSNE|nr:putative transcription factor c2h2 protein [Rosellinia necatrix]
MSAVTAVQYDPRMEMGGVPRSTYAWHAGIPGLESSPELLSHDISSVGHGSDISSLTPPNGSRSLTSSPPRPILTPEQRELKRQRDQARRDTKASARVRRGMSSHSYTSASQSPPVAMHDFSSASPMPVYTTAPSQISLLAEPVTTVAPSYMSSYSASPLPDHGNSQMFSPHYSPLPSNDYMGMNYSGGYPPPPSTQSLSSQYR